MSGEARATPVAAVPTRMPESIHPSDGMLQSTPVGSTSDGSTRDFRTWVGSAGRDSSTLSGPNLRNLQALPHLKDVTPELFVEQVEFLFPDSTMAARAAKFKLTSSVLNTLEASGRGGQATWEEIKSAVLFHRKRTNQAHESAYLMFIDKQAEGETVLAAWNRYLGICKSAEIQDSKAVRWENFKKRLTHAAKQAFRHELLGDDPLVCLEKIATAGDVAVFPQSSATGFAYTEAVAEAVQQVFAYSGRDVPGGSAKRFITCFNCGKKGHVAKDCRKSREDQSSPESDFQTPKPKKGKFGKGKWKGHPTQNRETPQPHQAGFQPQGSGKGKTRSFTQVPSRSWGKPGIPGQGVKAEGSNPRATEKPKVSKEVMAAFEPQPQDEESESL
jgi:hypothetical protein